MNQLRRVGVYSDTDVTLRDPDWEGLFHGFGLDSSYGSDSVAIYSVAIVEHPDGTVQLINVYYIRFLDQAVVEKEID